MFPTKLARATVTAVSVTLFVVVVFLLATFAVLLLPFIFASAIVWSFAARWPVGPPPGS
jgi:hypothetical protein